MISTNQLSKAAKNDIVSPTPFYRRIYKVVIINIDKIFGIYRSNELIDKVMIIANQEGAPISLVKHPKMILYRQRRFIEDFIR